MEIRRFRMFYFSPTGGVKGAAEAVSQAFAARTPSLEDITLPGVCAELGGDELAAFFFPVYGGRVPDPAWPGWRPWRGRAPRRCWRRYTATGRWTMPFWR